VNVNAERLPDALRVLRDAAAVTRPFRVQFGAPATFLPDTPVLYLPVLPEKGEDELRELRERVFAKPLARALTWPFVPHVTLTDEAEPDRIGAALKALADYGAEASFDRLHLLEEGKGRVWAPIADAPFEAPAVVGRGGLPVELSVTTRLDPEARAVFDREWEAHDLAEFGRTGKPEMVAITARRDGAVVGAAVGWTLGRVARLNDVIVVAEHRRQGIGSRLLAAFESHAAGQGCEEMVLTALAGGAAEKFYKTRGWIEDRRRPRWTLGRDIVELRRGVG
jgi:GNAT superfamily N-acetyltransferase